MSTFMFDIDSNHSSPPRSTSSKESGDIVEYTAPKINFPPTTTNFPLVMKKWNPLYSAIHNSNPFLGLDLMGFAPVKEVIARNEQKAKAKNTGKNLGNKEITQVAGSKYKKNEARPTRSEYYRPLALGESLWNPRIHPIRFQNLLGGWC
ncbi:hypothetical protein J1614_007538 [Plenodomus biglobosus]|nr:hypothetical protein J1614_007538 [Plenodomus biglobosus]